MSTPTPAQPGAAPKPMATALLAELRAAIEAEKCGVSWGLAITLQELLADRDHHAAEAERRKDAEQVWAATVERQSKELAETCDKVDALTAEVESRGALLAEWQLACGRHQRAAFDAQAEVERLHLQLNRANTGMCAGSPNCANGRTFCEYHAAKFEASSKAEAERLNAEVERLRPLADALELARDLVSDLNRRGAECARHACAHADAGLTVDVGRCIGEKDAYVRAAGLLASALRVSPRAGEGAATSRVPRGGPASMWPQVSEHAAENGDDPTLCECGNLGECIGQFEGETRPALGCPGCCKHDDMGAGGRCWPIVWEGAATPTQEERARRVLSAIADAEVESAERMTEAELRAEALAEGRDFDADVEHTRQVMLDAVADFERGEP